MFVRGFSFSGLNKGGTADSKDLSFITKGRSFLFAAAFRPTSRRIADSAVSERLDLATMPKACMAAARLAFGVVAGKGVSQKAARLKFTSLAAAFR